MSIAELHIGLDAPPSYLALDGTALFLDLDGTLAPIAARPQDATTAIYRIVIASDYSEKWIPLFGPMLYRPLGDSEPCLRQERGSPPS